MGFIDVLMAVVSICGAIGVWVIIYSSYLISKINDK
jgi:hypothetical protein